MTTEKIEIDMTLYTRIKDRIPETEFENVDEYVQYCMERLVNEIENSEDNPETTTEQDEEVKKRLKDLGYLNE